MHQSVVKIIIQYLFVGVGSLAIWYLIRWWIGDQLYPIRIFNYGAPWLLSGLVIVLIIMGWPYRQKTWWRTLIVSTLFITLPIFLPFLPHSNAVSSPTVSYKIVSYNVCKSNWDFKALIDVIRQAQPDLLLLQELRPDYAQRLPERLSNLYADEQGKSYFMYDSLLNQAVISRYPLAPLEPALSQGRVQKVKMETPQGLVEVWNVHANQPFFWQQHYQELTALAKAISLVEEPLIVGGDFNTTDQSEIYRLITAHLYNAHQQAGWGFGFTFPAPNADVYCNYDFQQSLIPPMVRIDHIFYSHHFYAHQAETLSDGGGSDHLPIMAELSWRNRQD